VLATLPEAVKVMQLGVSLNDADTRDIVAFLESLTGERGEFRHCPGSSVRRRHGSENSGRRLLRIKLWLTRAY